MCAEYLGGLAGAGVKS